VDSVALCVVVCATSAGGGSIGGASSPQANISVPRRSIPRFSQRIVMQRFEQPSCHLEYPGLARIFDRLADLRRPVENGPPG
jgi:hypothetical protein